MLLNSLHETYIVITHKIRKYKKATFQSLQTSKPLTLLVVVVVRGSRDVVR